MKVNEFPPLPYPVDSLEPFIDAETVHLHYHKHHHGYFEKFIKRLKELNLEKSALSSLEQVLGETAKFDNEIRHQGGGFYNHCFFWDSMVPYSPLKKDFADTMFGESTLKDAIEEKWKSFDEFKKEFTEVAKKLFGSGWVWLIAHENNKLEIIETANQDNPLMKVGGKEGAPLLVLDVWEHAYYLKYKNDRESFIEEWWNLVNWKIVQERFEIRSI